MRAWRSARRRAALAAFSGVALAGTIAGVAVAEAAGSTIPKPRTAPQSHQASSQNAARHEPRHERTVRRLAGLRTSCRSVAHIGDSISVDLISADFLPNPAQRLPARYAAVGVKRLRIDASSGRSVVEALPGQVNGYNVAKAWRAAGYRGCWVFALGTNDVADVANGSAVGYAARINEMMSVAHGQPVMWVNTITTTPTGFWASPNERAWDKALVKAAAKYPNMRIFDWAAVARPGWFLPDGIHYTPAGCAVRAKAIADALARAFPRSGHSNGDIVN
jgi:hypothetical protein